MYKSTGNYRYLLILFINISLIVAVFGMMLSGCGDDEKKIWAKTIFTNTQIAYLEYLKKYPDSQYAGEAEEKSRDFLIKVTGEGVLSLPDGLEKNGPIVEILPLWDARVVNLDEDSFFAVNKNDKKVKMKYFIPVELGNHTAKTAPTKLPAEGEYAAQETWIPQVNTFTSRYNAFGTSDNKIFFVLEFTDKKTAIKFGVIFEEDYADLATIHALGQTIHLQQAKDHG